jgi:diacylglycerol kinase family enzyme
LGTTNDFARTHGIPLRPTAAIDVLKGGKVTDVDLGDIDGITSPSWSASGSPPRSPPGCPPDLNA